MSGSRYGRVVTSCERHNQLSTVTDRSRSLVYLNCDFHLNPLLDGFRLVFCTHQGVTYSKYIDLVYFPLWAQKWSCYRPSVAQRVGRGITILFHDRGTRRGWVISSTPRPHFSPGKDPVPILQEAWWAPGLVWTGGKPRPHRDSIPDRPARSQSLYWLSYPAHFMG